MRQFPGPEALRILKDAERYYATNTRGSRILVHSGTGSIVTDFDGFEFYDLHCDASVNNLGRDNWRVKNAINFQLNSGNFFSEHHNSPHPKTVELSRILTENKFEKNPKPLDTLVTRNETAISFRCRN